MPHASPTPQARTQSVYNPWFLDTNAVGPVVIRTHDDFDHQITFPLATVHQWEGETREEAEAKARLMVAAPVLRWESQQLYDALQRYLMGTPDRELPKELVEAMNRMEDAWHKADGTTPEAE